MISFNNSEMCYEKYMASISQIKYLLEFKYNYDKDFEVDLADPAAPKFSVVYNLSQQKYETVITFDMFRVSDVYFSTKRIADTCAEWLNQNTSDQSRRLYDDREDRRCCLCKSP